VAARLILLAVAAFAAGVMNALAGGGSFLTFPALMLTGLDPRAANITSTVALFPGQISTGLAGRAFLNVLRQERVLSWTFLSPSALFVPGERTGRFRLGADQLLTSAEGKSWISFEDFAIALFDELEHPKHERGRFTVGY
jgi:hypothetical protein